MTTFETTRHQVAIAGQVTDLETTRSIAGALVRITAAPAEFLTRLATEFAASNGWYLGIARVEGTPIAAASRISTGVSEYWIVRLRGR